MSWRPTAIMRTSTARKYEGIFVLNLLVTDKISIQDKHTGKTIVAQLCVTQFPVSSESMGKQ